MPCTCDGYPEPTIAEQVDRLAKAHRELYDCHQEVVAERDALKAENEKLVRKLADKVLADP